MNDNQLKELLKNSIEKVYQESPSLLEKKGIEQAIVFRVGIHLHSMIKEENALARYHLDCEYNKKGDNPKKDINGNVIRPDLLIHKRGEDNNILAVEFKGGWNQKNIDNDKDKLCNLTHPAQGYAYQLGILVILNKDSPKYIFYKNGEAINNLE